MTGVHALVLAGTRAGGDPLAAAVGAGHKALIEVGGASMLDRVLAALAEVPAIEAVTVAIERPELVRDHVRVRTLPTGAGPAATVAAALATLPTPLLVTTADHALLRGDWVAALLAAAPVDADVVVALARRDAVEAAAPGSRRTWLRFRDGDFSGCNLFLFAGPRGAAVAALWQDFERDRKRPLAMARRLGWRSVLRYATRTLSLAAAAARVGALAGGARIAFVVLDDGRAAIDVDSVADLALVRSLAATAPIPASPVPGPPSISR